MTFTAKSFDRDFSWNMPPFSARSSRIAYITDDYVIIPGTSVVGYAAPNPGFKTLPHFFHSGRFTGMRSYLPATGLEKLRMFDNLSRLWSILRELLC